MLHHFKKHLVLDRVLEQQYLRAYFLEVLNNVSQNSAFALKSEVWVKKLIVARNTKSVHIYRKQFSFNRYIFISFSRIHLKFVPSALVAYVLVHRLWWAPNVQILLGIVALQSKRYEYNLIEAQRSAQGSVVSFILESEYFF